MRFSLWTAAAVATVVLVSGGVISSGAFAAGGAAGGRPVPVVYDSDMDFDDASTLAYLCEEHKLRRVELRAVTVANNGFGHPERTLRHARSVLEQCGLPGVPVAEGGTGAGVNPAPAELVATIESVLSGALGDGARPPYQAPGTAAGLIARAVRQAGPPVTVIATGPMTNLAGALRQRGVAERIGRIQIMGGAIDVPGNLYGSALPGFDNSQEFNMWMDPPAARAVLRDARPGTVHLVPLDATASVPITQDYVARLAADQHAPGARITYRIASHPEMAALIDLGIMYWWDAAAAVSAVHDGIVTTPRRVRLDVVLAGEQSGRTVRAPRGWPVRAAFGADRAAFEQRFLDSLNGRR
ncbi:nucleoside hydrolase [Asanoa siamensis]|uniref:Pyrimidine-specific ribonucleoside hydrolase RihA n=1 Tax=Asanoa siamensis TaxID=926357 RepID=A0ABQ4CX82_9ACTN|nr:nucleoside hydrolase [Asanoa siamensis]GIF75902.1 pyrimidine-specific ribonucleoside hydrolase RihA [Asanoa siamensis]